MTQETIFLIAIFCNTIGCLFYLFFGHLLHPWFRKKTGHKQKEDRKVYTIKGIIMLLCPVIGPLFFMTGRIFYLTLFRQEVDLEDVIFSKQRAVLHAKSDEDSERNMVPLEEAIAVSDTSSLRTLMLNVIKGDIQHSLSVIALALNSEDSEISHYAASVLRDELNDFRETVQKVYLEIQKEKTSETQCEQMLIPYMNRVLEQKVFTQLEQETFVHMMADAGDILYKKNESLVTIQFYEAICMRLLDIADFKGTEMWCNRVKQQYPKELATYTCQLKLYFTSNQREKFFQVMKELKDSSIVIDSETLELIRIFS